MHIYIYLYYITNVLYNKNRYLNCHKCNGIALFVPMVYIFTNRNISEKNI